MEGGKSATACDSTKQGTLVQSLRPTGRGKNFPSHTLDLVVLETLLLLQNGYRHGACSIWSWAYGAMTLPIEPRQERQV